MEWIHYGIAAAVLQGYAIICNLIIQYIDVFHLTTLFINTAQILIFLFQDFSQPLRNESLSKSTSYSSTTLPRYQTSTSSSTLRSDEPAYYGTNSSSRRFSRTDTADDIKDEATAIRLAAEMASKKATDDVSGYAGGRTSSSRARIRELLDKQRVVDQVRKTSDVDEKAQNAFKADYGKMLWVFR